VKFDKTGILSRDWSNYPILTMPDVPKVEVALINPPDRAFARLRARLHRVPRCGDCQRVRTCDRQAPARPAVPSRAGEGGFGIAVINLLHIPREREPSMSVIKLRLV